MGDIPSWIWGVTLSFAGWYVARSVNPTIEFHFLFGSTYVLLLSSMVLWFPFFSVVSNFGVNVQKLAHTRLMETGQSDTYATQPLWIVGVSLRSLLILLF